MNSKKIAFIGLGVMGYPMAGHLSKNGYSVSVFNRSQEKSQRWVEEFNGDCFGTPREAANKADIVFICVGNDDDVRSVFYGAEGVLAGLKPGSIIVDHTTTSAFLAEELYQASRENNNAFIDAPVSGGQAGAEAGCLTVMCGGDKDVFESVRPVMDAYSKQVQLLGSAGQGQRCKMVNQLCIAGVLQGLSEGLMLAEAAELDIHQVVETLKHGAAGSWQMENRMETMAQDKFDFGFAIDWMRKDLGICLAEADIHQLSLNCARSVDAMYEKLQQRGLGRMDTSVLVKAVKEKE